MAESRNEELRLQGANGIGLRVAQLEVTAPNFCPAAPSGNGLSDSRSVV